MHSQTLRGLLYCISDLLQLCQHVMQDTLILYQLVVLWHEDVSNPFASILQALAKAVPLSSAIAGWHVRQQLRYFGWYNEMTFVAASTSVTQVAWKERPTIAPVRVLKHQNLTSHRFHHVFAMYVSWFDCSGVFCLDVRCSKGQYGWPCDLPLGSMDLRVASQWIFFFSYAVRSANGTWKFHRLRDRDPAT